MTRTLRALALVLAGVLIGLSVVYGQSVYKDLRFLHQARLTYEAMKGKK